MIDGVIFHGTAQVYRSEDSDERPLPFARKVSSAGNARIIRADGQVRQFFCFGSCQTISLDFAMTEVDDFPRMFHFQPD